MSFVYIFENEFMPNLYKIGMTSRSPEERLTELHSTGVPGRFNIVAKYQVYDAPAIESRTHELLIDKRVDSSREFFRGPLEEIEKTILRAISDLDDHAGNKSVFVNSSRASKDYMPASIESAEGYYERLLRIEKEKIEQELEQQRIQTEEMARENAAKEEYARLKGFSSFSMMEECNRLGVPDERARQVLLMSQAKDRAMTKKLNLSPKKSRWVSDK